MTVSLSEKINRLVSKKQQRQSLQDIDIENDNDLDRLNNYDNDENSEDDEDEEDKKETEKLTKAHYVDVGESKLRKQLKKQQLELDSKYSGNIGSRKDLFEENSVNYSEDEHSENESEDGEVNEIEEDESDALSFRTDSEDEIIQEEDDEESGEEEEEEAEEDDNDERETRLSKIIDKETRIAMNNLSQLTKIDAQKGYSILKQTKFFENIVDLRIKLQKLLNFVNQLPLTNQSWSHIYNNDDTSSLLERNNKLLLKIFEKLFNLRLKFQLDDNITMKSSELNASDKNKKKRSYDALLNDTDKLNTDLHKYRNTVLNKWSAKIQMASGSQQLNATKFKSINQPANVQVENQLANKDRLIKRTRLNRTNVVPFNFENDYKEGKLSLLASDNSAINKENQDIESEEELDIPKNYDPRRKDNSLGLDLTENPYIFNDEDFYRLLLNDLLDKKLHDTTNNNGSGVNGTEIMITSTTSNSRDNKIKKNVDTKASKGRKLNYSIQEPIAHFETPINDGYHWSDEQIDEFFAGLLGQKIDFNESDNDESDDDHMDEERKKEELAIRNDDIQIFG